MPVTSSDVSIRPIGSRNLFGSSQELLFGGLPTFMRRHYSRELSDVDIAVVGVPYDLATSYRPGARFGPSVIRKASIDMAWWDKEFV